MHSGQVGKSGSTEHVAVVDVLRGLAAASVFWFHLTGLSFLTLPGLRASGAYGWLGVQAFFVISGFVIPYSLHRAGYRVAWFGTFLWKRIVRLDPPYLVTVAAAVGYFYLASHSSLHRGAAYDLSWQRILAHIGYVNAFVGLPWFIDVFWTLAIEFQYYLVVGLVYPALAWKGWWGTTATFLLGTIPALTIPGNQYLAHHAPIFLLGIFAFRYRALGTSREQWLLASAASILLAGYVDGIPEAVVAALASVVILFVKYSRPWLRSLGDISYSLYLTHALVTGIAVTQAIRFLGNGTPVQVTALLIGIAVAVTTAWFLNRFVEVPSKRWAAMIRYPAKPTS